MATLNDISFLFAYTNSQIQISTKLRSSSHTQHFTNPLLTSCNKQSTAKMCHWEVFLFKCNCYTLGIKEHCHQHRLKQTANCIEYQQVKQEWVHNQDKVCDTHKGQDDIYADGPTVKWKDLERHVWKRATEHAAKGDFPGKP